MGQVSYFDTRIGAKISMLKCCDLGCTIHPKLLGCIIEVPSLYIIKIPFHDIVGPRAPHRQHLHMSINNIVALNTLKEKY